MCRKTPDLLAFRLICRNSKFKFCSKGAAHTKRAEHLRNKDFTKRMAVFAVLHTTNRLFPCYFTLLLLLYQTVQAGIYRVMLQRCMLLIHSSLINALILIVNAEIQKAYSLLRIILIMCFLFMWEIKRRTSYTISFVPNIERVVNNNSSSEIFLESYPHFIGIYVYGFWIILWHCLGLNVSKWATEIAMNKWRWELEQGNWKRIMSRS